MHRFTGWTRSIAARLSWTGCVGLLVVLTAITVTMGVLATNNARQSRIDSLRDNARGVANALDAIDLTARSMVERFHATFASMVGRVRLDEAGGELYAGEAALKDNFEAVDRFKAETGGVATVFARRGDGFVRVSTSVRKQDGTRALGTELDPRGAAYAQVSQGLPYSGRAQLFGKPFMTHYEPVKDSSDKVVAVLFIGFEIGVFDDAVEDVVRRTRFFDTGGIYLVDMKGGWDDAVFAMHPTLKGRRLAEAMPEARVFHEALLKADSQAIPSPGVLSKEGARWSVVQRSAATGLTVIAEVSEEEAMRSHWEMLLPFGALLLMACIGLGAGLSFLARRWIAKPLQDLGAAARAVAAGDLTRACISDRDDDIGRLTKDVESMRGRFLELLLAIRGSADSIATASTEIASGNKDLSGRTENAASSLQETASSMEQLTGTVRQTAEAARSATGLASAASRSATEGAQAMREVIENMENIHRSARKISDISSVIDGIAFQTNLLALNAAVEAARAGNEGRGFAVVAAEVRSLAQRSAASAKEIRTLIDESVRTVSAGTTLVQGAGATMTGVVSDVHRVSQLIADIADSADEQSAGITQVNSAVGQLDALTQQNAALVEQSAASAESLQEQAVTLTGLLHQFSLKADVTVTT